MEIALCSENKCENSFDRKKIKNHLIKDPPGPRTKELGKDVAWLFNQILEDL